MNRLELEKEIIAEGKKRKIIITKCRIYDRGDYLEFYPTVKNESAKSWVYAHQVEDLINDLAPVERQHKVNKVELESRYFKIGEMVELDKLWIRLDAGEEEPKKLIKVGSGCGQWRSGWVKGEVVETPEQNDRVLVMKFERDVWIEAEHKWWGDIGGIEKAVVEGKIKKIEKGQPLCCGTGSWDIRKYSRVEK